VLLVAASCATGRAPIREESSPEIRPPLSRAEDDQAEALARYSQFLLLQEEQPDSIRLPDILQKVVDRDLRSATFRIWLANAYLSKGRAIEAITGLQDAVRRFPDSDALLYLLGMALEASDRIPEARRLYRRVIERVPGQPDAYVRLAGLALREEQIGEAFNLLDEAIKKVDEPLVILSVYDFLGEQFLAAKKPWLAAVCFGRIADRQPDNLAAHELLMKSRLAAGDRAGAVRELELLVTSDPAKDQWAYLLGELLEEQGEIERAAGWYEKALNSPAAKPEACIRLALIQSRSDLARGLETLRAGMTRFPADPQAAITAGALLYQVQRTREAIAAFEVAEARMKSLDRSKPVPFVSPFFYFWYGAACDREGQTGRAEALFEESIRLFPEVSEAFNYLAYLWAQQNVKLDRALDYSRRALAMKPDDPAYLDTLGWILFRQGNLEQALVQVSKAAEKVDDDEINLHMGDILEALGKPDEAAIWWRKSAALNPSGPAAEKVRKLAPAPARKP
jgi:tetratricopeptide (TPR) repeat protein